MDLQQMTYQFESPVFMVCWRNSRNWRPWPSVTRRDLTQ